MINGIKKFTIFDYILKGVYSGALVTNPVK